MSKLKLAVVAVCVVVSGCASTSKSGRNLSQLVQLKGDHIEVGESILFETGKATIESSSLELVDEVANILAHSPGITALAIEGHTDSTGDAEFNKTLSQQRADAVKSHLVSKGIAAARLTATGFGAEKPLAPNDTEAGRAKNRRVEFRVTGQ